MKSIITLRRVAMGAVLLGSALAISATPHAERVAVQYQDLDLSQPQDARVLYGRISAAARHVCHEPSLKGTVQALAYRRCYDLAIANAVDKVNVQTLTALHQSRVQKVRAS